MTDGRQADAIGYNHGNSAEVVLKRVIGDHIKTDISNGQTTPVVILPRDIQLIMWKGNTVPTYTVRPDGREDTVKVDREEGYDVDDSIQLTEEESRVIYDKNGEEKYRTIPLPVFGTVVAIE